MRRPRLPINPDPTDRKIAEQFAAFNALAKREGWHAANMQVMSELTACMLWLETAYGARRTFEYLQRVSDGLLAPELMQDGP
jgi:hypothetical protein